MIRRTPMKRAGFKPHMPPQKTAGNREQRLAERAQAAIKSVVPRAAVMGGSCTGAAVRKEAPLRSEKYRRAVASLPCAHCGALGYSQCAHANTGKGAGTKVSDLDSFPLCACQPGRRGCHSIFDQGAMFSKEERRAREIAWIEQTQRQVLALGLWPKGVSLPRGVCIKEGEA